jgi:pentatricopeptide repeat protein
VIRDSGAAISLWNLSLNLKFENLAQGTAPEVRTYNTVIGACSRAGQPGAAAGVYRRMLADGAAPTATTATALVSVFARAGQVCPPSKPWNCWNSTRNPAGARRACLGPDAGGTWARAQ